MKTKHNKKNRKKCKIQDWHDEDCIQRFGRDPCDCNYGKQMNENKKR
jgi:hypothetical protein